MFPLGFPRHGRLDVRLELLPEGVELVPVPRPCLPGAGRGHGSGAAQQSLSQGGARSSAMLNFNSKYVEHFETLSL